MTSGYFERAARIYCAHKNIDPEAFTLKNFNRNVDVIAEKLQEFELQKYCLLQAEDTKDDRKTNTR